MKASDYVVKCIADEGVGCVFGYQGGNIAHIIDSIGARKDMEFVSTYNEQGASFCACGYALENETIGVALASSGPGAINLISGIANAYYDSIPCLFITGNVSVPTMKQKDTIRQNAFQENDIVSMVSKVTKYAVTVFDVHDLKFHLGKALYLAREGRPGPVLIDLPHNIQKETLDFEFEKNFVQEDQGAVCGTSSIEQIIDLFTNAYRPLIIVGGGIQSTLEKAYVNQLLDAWDVPVVSTLRGLDVVSHNRRNYIGFGGAYGNRSANFAIKYSDLILVLGSRLDERFICSGDNNCFLKKNIIHVDVDEVELGRVVNENISLKCTVKHFLSKLFDYGISKLSYEKWMRVLQSWSVRYPSVTDDWTINKAVYELTNKARNNSIVCLDIGINQMCAAQAMVLNGKQNCYTSAGHGAMGCALPMAIGAVYADRTKIVNCFIGDGALHMNIQELLMLAKNHLPVHIILNNNQCLGMIRDFQTKAFASRFVGTVDELQDIDYGEIARAYKLNYCKVKSMDDIMAAIRMIHEPKPCFIELIFSEETDTMPKLGADMFNQLPLLSECEKKQMEQEALLCGNIISW